MSEARRKRPILVSPIGTALWPKLTEPETKFDPDGVYSVRLSLPEGSPEAEQLITVINEAREEALNMAKEQGKRGKIKEADPPYMQEYEKDSDTPTGNLLFNFKMKASGTSRDGRAWSRRPNLFDAHRNPIKPEDIDIWSGTRLRVAYTADPFFVPALGAGVSLRLQAAQIIELVQGGERTAESYGFGEEEGYTAAEDDPFAASSESATSPSPAPSENEDALAEADF